MKVILKYKGTEAPAKDIEFIHKSNAIEIIDGKKKLFLTNILPSEINEVRNALPQWSFHEEEFIPRPEHKKKITSK